MECHLGARRHVVDELHHPAAFVGAAGVVGHDVDARRKITAGDVCRIAADAACVETIRKHTDRHAAAVDAELGASQIGVHGRIALAVGYPDVGPRPQGRGGKLKAIEFGQLVDRIQRNPPRDARTPGGTLLETERLQIPQQGIGIAGSNGVDLNQSVGHLHERIGRLKSGQFRLAQVGSIVLEG